MHFEERLFGDDIFYLCFTTFVELLLASQRVC